MSIRQQVWLGRLIRLGLTLAISLVAVSWALNGSGTARADGTGTRLALNASGDGVSCDDSSEPTECVAPVSGSFFIVPEMIDPPAEGYVAVYTQVFLGGLTWVPRAIGDENVWPDNQLPVRAPDPPLYMASVVSHGGLTGVTEFPPSHYAGPIAEIEVTCSADEESFEVALINYDAAVAPLGSAYSLTPDSDPTGGKTVGERDVHLYNDDIVVTVPITDVLQISCEEIPPTPTPTTEVVAAPTATPSLPSTGDGGGAGDGDAGMWVVIGVLLSVAAVIGLSGWRAARRSN